VTPAIFAQRIAIVPGSVRHELVMRIDPWPPERIAEHAFAERTERFEHQNAAPAPQGTPAGQAQGSDEGLGGTVGTSVVPVTLVPAPPIVSVVVIQQMPVVQAPPPTAPVAAPVGKGNTAHAVAPPAAVAESAAAAVATTIARPTIAIAGAVRAASESNSSVVQTVEAIATTAAGAVGARVASSAPIVTATGAWGRVAAMDSTVTRYEQEFAAAGAGMARVAAALEQAFAVAVPGASGDVAASDMSAAPQRSFEFAHMGWPLSLLADSMANFAEDSAATAARTMPAAVTRGLAATVDRSAAWAVTATVVAADVVVLTYLNRRSARRRRERFFAGHAAIALTD
jgi:hypothetical protein